jgi:hypothetical protein
MRMALGRLADDEEAMTVLRAVIHPEFFDSIRAGTRSLDEVATPITAVFVPWFVGRARAVEEGF